MLFPAAIVAVILLSLSGCRAEEPMTEPEYRQAEQNTKVSINVVGDETADEAEAIEDLGEDTAEAEISGE